MRIRFLHRSKPQAAEGLQGLADVEAGEGVTSTEATGPRLVVLVPDAFGLARLRLESFTNVDSAASYIQSQSTNGSSNGAYAYWALHGRPACEAQHGFECLVLIRRENDSNVVSPFSFVNMEYAESAARAELRHGLDPRLLLIFWAVPVTIEFGDHGEVSLNPAVPPGTRAAREEAETHTTPVVAISDLIDSEALQRIPAAASARTALAETSGATARTHAPTSALAPIWIPASVPSLDTQSDSIIASEVVKRAEANHQETRTVEVVEDAQSETEAVEGVGTGPDEGETEATRILPERRWKSHDQPFRGFGSPLGKF